MVVDHNLDDRNIVSAGCCQFIQIHTETSVSGNIDTDLIRSAGLCTDAGPQPIAHRPETAGRKESSGLRILIILRRPHLMLSHIRGDHCLSLCQPVDLLYDIRTGQTALIVSQRILLF